MQMSRTIAEAILEGTQILRRAGVADARLDASYLMAGVLSQDRAFIISHAADPLSAEDSETFRIRLDRRASGEPLQYITGHQEFFGLDFEVTPDVLIPRPETETLVELALELVQPLTNDLCLCDLGTGSGCIAISLLHRLPRARGVAIDISAPAVHIAKRNAARHNVRKRLQFIVADCFTAFPDPSNTSITFDLIVSNPPYVGEGELPALQREVREHEPIAALTSGADGLTLIRRLLREAPPFLKPAGYLVFEIGYGQRPAVEALIDSVVWQLIEVRNDLQRIPRTFALKRLA